MVCAGLFTELVVFCLFYILISQMKIPSFAEWAIVCCADFHEKLFLVSVNIMFVAFIFTYLRHIEPWTNKCHCICYSSFSCLSSRTRNPK